MLSRSGLEVGSIGGVKCKLRSVICLNCFRLLKCTQSASGGSQLLLTCITGTAGVRMGDNSMTPKRLPTWIFAIGHLGALGHRIFEITMLSLCAGILKGAARQLPIASALASSSFQQIRNASHAENTNVFLKEVGAYPNICIHFALYADWDSAPRHRRHCFNWSTRRSSRSCS